MLGGFRVSRVSSLDQGPNTQLGAKAWGVESARALSFFTRCLQGVDVDSSFDLFSLLGAFCFCRVSLRASRFLSGFGVLGLLRHFRFFVVIVLLFRHGFGLC